MTCLTGKAELRLITFLRGRNSGLSLAQYVKIRFNINPFTGVLLLPQQPMTDSSKGAVPPAIASSKLHLVPQDAVSFVEIGPDTDGQRLDNFLLKLGKSVPKSHIYRIIRGGEVRVNKSRAKAETKLALGDIVRIPPMRRSRDQVSKPDAVPLSGDALDVLFEDRHLLIVNKPSGLASHGGSGISHGLIERLRATRPDEPFLELAHRLDKETSGAIIIAKSRKALVRMHDMMKNNGFEKHYSALVKGDWVNERQHVKLPLLRTLLPTGERFVRVDRTEGAFAHSIFTVIRRFGPVTLLDVELKTGRTHQIRVHALSQGFPLVGDDKYGDFEFNREVRGGLLGVSFKRMFLHARVLRFNHPVTGEPCEVQAPLPPECLALLDALSS